MSTQATSGPSGSGSAGDARASSSVARLQEAHDRLQAILQALPDLLFVLDRDGRIYDYHAPAMERLYVPPEQFLGRTMDDVLPEPARGIVRWAIDDAVAHGFHYGSAYPLHTAAGDRWFEMSIAAQGDPQTPQGRLVAIARDITDRRQAMEALRESEAQFRMLTEGVRDVAWVFDVEERRFTYVSPSVEALRGYTPEEILARPFEEALVPEQREAVTGLLEHHADRFLHREVDENAYFTLQIQQPCKDGSRVPSEAVCRLVRNGFNGRLEVHGITRDMSARVRAEDSLRLFKESVENSSDAVGMSTPDGRHYYQNRAFDELFGPVGENPPDTLFADPAVGREVFGTIMAGGQWTGEVQMHARDGRILDILLRAYANQDESGRITALLGIHTDITERKRVEKTLRENEERFEQSTKQSRTYLWEVDADGLFTFVSPVVEDVLGYRPEELVGRRHFYDLMPEARRESFKAEILEAIRQRLSFRDYENPCQSKDGRMVWVVSSAIPLLNPDGTLKGYRGNDTDITARKQAEGELRQSEQKYRTLHETMRDAFVSVDMEGHILEANAVFRELIGYDKNELCVLTYKDLTPDKWHAFEARIVAKQIVPRGYSDVYQKEYIRKDGSVVPVELRTILIRDDAGQPAGMWATIRDITARLRVERALKQATTELDRRVKERTADLEASREALKRSEEQFRQMTEIVQEVFWLLDVQTGQVLYVSPAFENIWKRSPREFMSGMPAWLATLHPDDRERVHQDFVRGLETGEFTRMEYRILRPDGAIRWIQDSAWAIRDAQGAIHRVAGVFHDVTDRRRLEADILNATELERQRLGGDLHDSLGQALTGIGYLAEALREELARESRPEAVEAGKLARLVVEAADRAHSMARGLLLADMKRGGLAPALQELAFRTQELFGVECRYEGLTEVGLSDMETAGQLYRIAQEAATNAAKHGDGKDVAIRLDRMPDGLLLSIRDAGPGMPDPNGKETRMGLDIMRYRAGLVGGTFWIDSRPGMGTTVNCLLPRSSLNPEKTP